MKLFLEFVIEAIAYGISHIFPNYPLPTFFCIFPADKISAVLSVKPSGNTLFDIVSRVYVSL